MSTDTPRRELIDKIRQFPTQLEQVICNLMLKSLVVNFISHFHGTVVLPYQIF